MAGTDVDHDHDVAQANAANVVLSHGRESAEAQKQLIAEIEAFRDRGEAAVMRRGAMNAVAAAVASAGFFYAVKRRFYPAAKPQPFVFLGVMPPIATFVMTTDKGAIHVDEEIQRRYFNNTPSSEYFSNTALAASYQPRKSLFSADGLYDFGMRNRVSLVAGAWIATVAGVFIYQYRTPGLTSFQRGYNMRLFSQVSAFTAICAAMGLTAMQSPEQAEKYRRSNERSEKLDKLVAKHIPPPGNDNPTHKTSI